MTTDALQERVARAALTLTAEMTALTDAVDFGSIDPALLRGATRIAQVSLDLLHTQPGVIDETPESVARLTYEVLHPGVTLDRDYPGVQHLYVAVAACAIALIGAWIAATAPRRASSA